MEIVIIAVLIVVVVVALKALIDAVGQRDKLKEEMGRKVKAAQDTAEKKVNKAEQKAEEIRQARSDLAREVKSLQRTIKSLTSQNEKLANVGNKGLTKLGRKYINDIKREIIKDITPNNYASSHKKLEKIVQYCEDTGVELEINSWVSHEKDLKEKYEAAVKKDLARQEQARIKEQIREEQLAEKEFQRELQRIENEEHAIEKAIQAAIARTSDGHSAEVERLRAQLVEAQERFQRTKSRAEMTRAGHVYVISNVGSFGEEIFKVGMTRRLEPLDRVKELGDASVPFPFDVHMMISCDDAPTLEKTLHNELHAKRMNKVNLRKEFFNVDIDCIRQIVETNHGVVDYVAEPEAFEYYESRDMSDEDFAFTSGRDAETPTQPAAIDTLNSQPVTDDIGGAQEEIVVVKPETKPKIFKLPANPDQPGTYRARCGKCGKALSYPEKMIGRKAKCPECQTVFALP